MRFLDPTPFAVDKVLACIRIIVGALLIYHGQEIFHKDIMDGYVTWDAFKGPLATTLVYVGKVAELLSGILLFLGFLTRIGALLCIGVLSYVTFAVGQGRFWYEDQHPFMFVLFGVLFLFTGPGAWSVDGLIFRKTTS
jgi:putative oxidoreductase